MTLCNRGMDGEGLFPCAQPAGGYAGLHIDLCYYHAKLAAGLLVPAVGYGARPKKGDAGGQATARPGQGPRPT